MSSLALAISCLLLLPQTDVRPTADSLVLQARALLPTYTGEHRSFLSRAAAPRVVAAAHLLDGALALSPDDAYALWWRAHIATLLGEDAWNRGDSNVGRGHYETARAALRRAIELDAGRGYWAPYALGVTCLRLGDLAAGIEGLDAAVLAATAVIDAAEEGADVQDARFVEFKARQWRAEARMRALQFDTARTEWRQFYSDYGNSRWDLAMSSAESCLRERDFAAAARHYAELATDPELGRYDASHAALGYLAGLRGDAVAARAHLDEAIDLENVPTVYPMLWRWLLQGDPNAVDARADFEKLADDLPESVPAWDATLSEFMLERIDQTEFLAAAAAERERRIEADESLAGFDCECWFYIGERARMRGENGAAVRAFVRSLDDVTESFQWEWAFARSRLEEIAATDSLRPDPDVAAESWPHREGVVAVEHFGWHRAGEPTPRARDRSQLDAGDVKVGDLLQGVAVFGDGRREVVRTVILPAKSAPESQRR